MTRGLTDGLPLGRASPSRSAGHAAGFPRRHPYSNVRRCSPGADGAPPGARSHQHAPGTYRRHLVSQCRRRGKSQTRMDGPLRGRLVRQAACGKRAIALDAGAPFYVHGSHAKPAGVAPGPVLALPTSISGCSSVWSEHRVWDAGAAGSNPSIRTISRRKASLHNWMTVRAAKQKNAAVRNSPVQAHLTFYTSPPTTGGTAGFGSADEATSGPQSSCNTRERQTD